MSGDWKTWKEFPWPFKGGMYGCLSDPEYIKDRIATEIKHGNGWWVNDGKGWSMNWESPMVYHKRKRIERENRNV